MLTPEQANKLSSIVSSNNSKVLINMKEKRKDTYINMYIISY